MDMLSVAPSYYRGLNHLPTEQTEQITLSPKHAMRILYLYLSNLIYLKQQLQY